MKTVLVVDDFVSIRKAIVDTLKRHGFNTVEATDGKDALDTLRSRIFSPLLCENFKLTRYLFISLLTLDGLCSLRNFMVLYQFPYLSFKPLALPFTGESIPKRDDLQFLEKIQLADY
ncbi:hypothetical protein JMN32_19955 [Fulvivirga sp. 29W222]|uniref:Response regulatory domain-containing protein n=1 Tax=Fulvivirga marina TaxID=2494733 RepID=A0A937G1S0_9BACT|nr:hypothetical protein [Fulvivirga marina]MBL6448596.1 hypothetical protein [Fulvivirga marina]